MRKRLDEVVEKNERGGLRGAKRRRTASTIEKFFPPPSQNNKSCFRPRSTPLAPRAWLMGAALLISSLVSLSDGAPYDFCYGQLKRADANANDQLTTAEFTTAVNYISGGNVAALNASVFGAGQTNGIFTISALRATGTNAFCDTLYIAILAAQTKVASSATKCLFAMSIGDSNRDSSLAKLVEYPRYANQLSGNKYGFSTTFDGLPAYVQAVFGDFSDATTGLVNIIGAKASETLTAAQGITLNSFCRSTGIAVLAADGDVATPVAKAPAAAPTAAAAPVVTTPAFAEGVPSGFKPSFTSATCFRMIAFTDVSRDNKLSSSEYYAFVNRLSADAFKVAGSYDALPDVLKTNYQSLAGSGEINVFGSKPGQTATQDDTDRLTKLCIDTDVALQAAVGQLSPGSAPSSDTGGPAPVAAAPDSALPFESCTKSMIIADLSRDSGLNKIEFVRFISRVDNKVRVTDAFSALSQPVQDVFSALAVDGQINVAGSKPSESPTDAQSSHLRDICAKVGAALSQSAALPAAPLLSGNVTVYNSFIISNTVRLRASALQDGPNRDGLNKAYALFVQTAIANYTGDVSSSSISNNATKTSTRKRHMQSRRRRSLLISGAQRNSSTIYLLRDSICPKFVTGGNDYCQTVFASFEADFVAMDPQNVSMDLTNFTQALIDPLLVSSLSAVSPANNIRINGASAAVEPKDANIPDFQLPSDANVQSDGPNLGQIVAGVIIIVFVIGGGAYYWNVRRNKGKANAGDDKVEAQIGDDRLDDENDYGVESALSYANAKPAKDATFGGAGGDNNGDSENDDENGGDDDDSVVFSVQEQSPTAQDQQEKAGGKIFNAFGLGKKRNSSIDDDIGILETNDDFQDGGDDFGNYAYEEPSEMLASSVPNSFGGSASGGQVWIAQDPDGEWGGNGWCAAPSSDKQNNDDGFGDIARSPKAAENAGDDADFSRRSGSGSESSGSNSEFDKSSLVSGASGDVGKLKGLVDNGDWTGVMQTAAQLENNLHDSVSSNHSDDKSFAGSRSDSDTSFGVGGVDANGETNGSDFVSDPFDDRTTQTDTSMTSEEHRRREKYRSQIEDLVRKAAPDEINNVSMMMSQFAGREAELINTLQTMYQRTTSQRRLKAVHKSKAIPERDARGLATGGAEGSAVIAAASMLNADTVPVAKDDERSESSFDENASYYDDDENSASGSRSYTDEEDEGFDDDDRSASASRTGSYDDQEGDENRSASGSRTGSYDDQEGDENRSATGSRTGSYDDQERSYAGSHTGTGSGSGTRNYDDQEGSGSRSGSYDDDQDRSPAGNRTGIYDDDLDDQDDEVSGSFDDQGSFSGSRSASQDQSNRDDDGSYSDEEK